MAAYRNDLDALSARHDALSAELATKTKEVADAANLLEEARTRARLPVLDNLRVASPCTADWAKMTGDERTRFCGDCKKSVFNLSNMTRDEAQALIIEKEGKLCARYYQRSDGTILLKDCSVGVGKRRKRRIIAVGAFALLGTAALFAFKRSHESADVPTCGAPSVEPDSYAVVGVIPVEMPPIEIQHVQGGIGQPDEEQTQVMLGDIK